MPSRRASKKHAGKTNRSSASATTASIPDRPHLVIIAGPNGSGKSSFSQSAVIEEFGRTVWIIDPDLLARRIRAFEALGMNAANLEAVKRIESWLKISVKAHQTVGVETVLSTPKYRKLVRAAKKRGFKIALIYVLLNSPALHVARVQMRVEKGGHGVPKNKILSRRTRSLAQLPWFLQAADEAWLYDNSGASPRLNGVKRDGMIVLDRDALPEFQDVVGYDPE
jgi:predicted ABC-type ATPase